MEEGSGSASARDSAADMKPYVSAAVREWKGFGALQLKVVGGAGVGGLVSD